MIEQKILDDLNMLKSEVSLDARLVGFTSNIKHVFGIDIIPYENGDMVFPITNKSRLPSVLTDYVRLQHKLPVVLLADDKKIEALSIKYIERRQDNLQNEQDDSPAMKVFTEVVQRGWHLNASDIIIRLIYADNGRVDTAYADYKVNGQLLNEKGKEKTFVLTNYKEGLEMLGAFFNYYSEGGKDDFNVHSQQQASTTITVKDKSGQETRVRIRAEKAPTGRDDKEIVCVLRLLDPNIKNHKQLNTPDWVVKMCEKHVTADKGLVITSGPMASGKSTFMLATLMMFPRYKSLQTVESPVEYELPQEQYPNVIQNSLGPDDSPEKVISRLSRVNPDALFVGEINNHKTAELSLKFAETGRLCFATVHSNSAVTIPTRLMSMKVAKETLITPGTLRLLIAQRLYPQICTNCCETTDDDEYQEVLQAIKADFEGRLFKRNIKGCSECSAGITGVKAYIEMVEVGSKDRAFIRDNDIEGWKKYLVDKGVNFIEDQIIRDMNKGTLCAIEMVKVLHSERQQEERVIN